MPQLFTNFAATTIVGSLSDVATSVIVSDASLMPEPTGDDFFIMVLATALTEATREVVKCTSRTGNTLTIVRGQEGTTPSAFNNGDKAEIRETASILNSISGLVIPVHEVAHGFTTGKPVYFDGSFWQLAKADSDLTLGVGIVWVIDADNFYVHLTGLVTGMSGLTAGQYYFVSDVVAGQLTDTEPPNPASFSNPILQAITTSSGIVLPFRPSQVLSDVSYVPLPDFLLDNEPIAQGCSYAMTRSAGRVSNESWYYGGPSLVKSIDYTYVGGLVATEVRQVFDGNGYINVTLHHAVQSGETLVWTNPDTNQFLLQTAPTLYTLFASQEVRTITSPVLGISGGQNAGETLSDVPRTNLVLQSDFAGSGVAPTGWSPLIGTGTSAPVVSIFGAEDGCQAYIQTAVAGQPWFYQVVDIDAGKTYCISLLIEDVIGTMDAQECLLPSSLPGDASYSFPVCAANPSGGAIGNVTTGVLECLVTTTATPANVVFRAGIGCASPQTGTLKFSRPQVNEGTSRGIFIPTTTAAVTQTDYTAAAFVSPVTAKCTITYTYNAGYLSSANYVRNI